MKGDVKMNARAVSGYGIRGGILALSIGLLACQSTPEPRRTKAPASPAKAKVTERVVENPGRQDSKKTTGEETETFTLRELPKGPQDASDIASFYASRCPVAPFSLAEPEDYTVAGHTFSVHGSRWERVGENWSGDLRLGILGALKDASPGTKRNVRNAARRFRKEKVDFVIANGDLGEDKELQDVFELLGNTFQVPILVFAGNIEWTAAFTEAFEKARVNHPHLINGNWTRHLDLGGVHLLTLPGWSNRRFMQSGACRYGDRDIEDLRRTAEPLVTAGEQVVLLTHGPPRGDGPEALDMTHDAGNVGNEGLRKLIDELPISFGIFSHILESGGRIGTNVAGDGPLKTPVRDAQERLYLNVGSASAFAWEMLDNRRSEGMAAVFRLRNGRATARILSLKSRR